MRRYSLFLITVFTPFLVTQASINTNQISPDLLLKNGTEKTDIFLDQLESYPHYFQRDTAFGGFEYNGRVYCGPVAASNALVRFFNQGYTKILDQSKNPVRDHHELIKQLGSSRYFNTANSGTSANSISKGLERFFRDRNISGVDIEYQGWRTIASRFFSAKKSIPDLEEMKESLRNNEAILINLGWYRYNKERDVYERTGGHWVTLAGYGHDGEKASPSSLVVIDPEKRTRSEKHLEIEKIESGVLKGSFRGLPRKAEGFYKFRHTRSRYGIIDGIVKVKMPETQLSARR